MYVGWSSPTQLNPAAMATTSLEEACKGLVVDTHDVAHDVTDAVLEALHDAVLPAVLAMRTHAAKAAKNPELYREVNEEEAAALQDGLIDKLNRLIRTGRGATLTVDMPWLPWAHLDIELDKTDDGRIKVEYVATTSKAIRIKKENRVEAVLHFSMVDARD